MPFQTHFLVGHPFGDKVNPEEIFEGPFTTHEAAVEALETHDLNKGHPARVVTLEELPAPGFCGFADDYRVRFEIDDEERDATTDHNGFVAIFCGLIDDVDSHTNDDDEPVPNIVQVRFAGDEEPSLLPANSWSRATLLSKAPGF